MTDLTNPTEPTGPTDPTIATSAVGSVGSVGRVPPRANQLAPRKTPEQCPGCVDISLAQQEDTAVTPDAAWDALNSALEDVAPPCKGQALFTADRLSDEERELCESICSGCPFFDLCDDYATTAKVDAGYWAGVERSPKRRITQSRRVQPSTPAPDGIRQTSTK